MRSQTAMGFVWFTLIFLASCSQNAGSDQAMRSRQSVQSVQSVQQGQQAQTAQTIQTGQTPSVLTNDGDLVLKIGEVFAQGNTNLCWAFSAFHALRTYFDGLANPDNAASAWKTQLGKLNSQSALSAFLSSKVDVQKGDDPRIFSSLMEKEFGLQKLDWFDLENETTKNGATQGSNSASGYDESRCQEFGDCDCFVNHQYVCNDSGSAGSGNATQSSSDADLPMDYVPLSQIKDKIKKHLSLGIPLVYCGDQHCRMIYGVRVKSDAIEEYYFADSYGSQRTYKEQASQTDSKFEGILSVK